MKNYCLEVTGDYACFTRPEFKVERVSYDVITPSAARSIFDSILWKPAIRWQITKIEVINPIEWTSIRRNEVDKIASMSSSGIIVEENRQQRASLILKNVAYRIYAEINLIPIIEQFKVQKLTPEELKSVTEKNDERKDESIEKYQAMFERRARKGQCFNQPYFGCREFSCHFKLIEEKSNQVILKSGSKELGWMIYDMDFSNPKDIKPMLYRPELKDGVIIVPKYNSDEVRK